MVVYGAALKSHGIYLNVMHGGNCLHLISTMQVIDNLKVVLPQLLVEKVELMLFTRF